MRIGIANTRLTHVSCAAAWWWSRVAVGRLLPDLAYPVGLPVLPPAAVHVLAQRAAISRARRRPRDIMRPTQTAPAAR